MLYQDGNIKNAFNSCRLIKKSLLWTLLKKDLTVSSHSTTPFGHMTGFLSEIRINTHILILAANTVIRIRFGSSWVSKCSIMLGKDWTSLRLPTGKQVQENLIPFSVSQEVMANVEIPESFLWLQINYSRELETTRIQTLLSKLRSRWLKFIWRKSRICLSSPLSEDLLLKLNLTQLKSGCMEHAKKL